MTETRTLQFESARTLESLYAHDLKNLKTLEDSLGVKVTTREGWVKLEGEPAKIDKAQRVFDQLEQARQKGVDIHKTNSITRSARSTKRARKTWATSLRSKFPFRRDGRPLSRELRGNAITWKPFRSMMLFLESVRPEPAKPTWRWRWPSRL